MWSVFEVEHGLDYEQVQAFIKSLVEEHFKMKGVTPCIRKELINRSVRATNEIKAKRKNATNQNQ